MFVSDAGSVTVKYDKWNILLGMVTVPTSLLEIFNIKDSISFTQKYETIKHKYH